MNHYRNFITKIIQTFRKPKIHITRGGLIIWAGCGGMEEAVAQGQGGWAPPALGWGVTGTSLWGGGSYSWVTDRITDFSSWRRHLSPSANPALAGFEHQHVLWALEAKELWHKVSRLQSQEQWVKKQRGFRPCKTPMMQGGKSSWKPHLDK